AELSHDDNDNKPWLKKDEQEQCIEMDESGNYKIALILPFYLSQLVDEPTKMVDETDDISSPGYIKPFTFIHFYEGFMLAVDSLKQAGLNVEIFVFDLGNDAFETKLLLRNPELQYMDLIIGPVFSTSFKIVAAFAKEHRIFIVNPFSTRDEIIYDNEYVFKVRPSVDDQLRLLVDYLNNNHKSSQIFLARHDSYSHSLDIERLKSIFNQDLNQRVGPYTDLYHEIVYSRDSTYTFVHQATVDNENVVIAYSDDRVFIFDFLRKFNELRDTFNITIIGIPDWKKLDGLELEYLNNLNAHLISESYTDYTLDNVISFVNKFRDAYQTEPQEYAFEGYDIGYYFLGALKKFGKNFGRCIKYHDKRLLRYGFDFEQNQGNGYVNHSCKILSMWNYRYLDITPVFSETEK
nr:amino acid ABC transporter substrate-binding protein [Bacteroidota bacterium]